VFLSDYVKE